MTEISIAQHLPELGSEIIFSAHRTDSYIERISALSWESCLFIFSRDHSDRPLPGGVTNGPNPRQEDFINIRDPDPER